MSRKRKDNSPIGENWIKKRSKKDEHQQAIEKLSELKKFESEHEFEMTRKDGKTVIFKLKKQYI